LPPRQFSTDTPPQDGNLASNYDFLKLKFFIFFSPKILLPWRSVRRTRWLFSAFNYVASLAGDNAGNKVI